MKMQRSIRSEPNFSPGGGIRKQRKSLNSTASVPAIHNCRVEGSRSQAAGIMIEFIANAEIAMKEKNASGRAFNAAYMFRQYFFTGKQSVLR
ncbi:MULTISPECIES: hypothetical protein [Rhizobium]|uniref:Uncharacterized protein n=1 Tax=Rhizobium dioscoreae TaxID=2653122 RepID=A0ABQ0Z0M1_9HYPH|nr:MULTISPECIES: hypothetical protein [Rhizobium]GES49095.1 hypothetical protein RsS93_17090 [Rhizobium dioscoreae]GLU80537.1 hypothetical protein Rhsp01_17130 [Rhizobium sp. NBRC 114257]